MDFFFPLVILSELIVKYVNRVYYVCEHFRRATEMLERDHYLLSKVQIKNLPKVKLIPIYQVILGGSGFKNCHPRLSVHVLDETVKV